MKDDLQARAMKAYPRMGELTFKHQALIFKLVLMQEALEELRKYSERTNLNPYIKQALGTFKGAMVTFSYSFFEGVLNVNKIDKEEHVKVFNDDDGKISPV